MSAVSNSVRTSRSAHYATSLVMLACYLAAGAQASAQERHAVAITAGGWVVLRDDGKVVTFRDASNWRDPVVVKGLTDVIAIAGANPGWALRKDGVVLKWEYRCNNAEQPICDISPAQQISSLTGVKAISRHGDYGLFLLRNGSVWGLGDDRDGQITGFSADQLVGRPRIKNPVKKALSQPIAEIAAGWSHSVAIDDRGQVWTWGGANHSQTIGEGESVREADGSRSVKVASMPPAVKVAAANQAYSVDRDGHVWQWGSTTITAANGKIRSGGPIPSMISGLKDVVKVSASSLFAAALDAQGRVAIVGVMPEQIAHSRGDPRQGAFEAEPTYVQGLSGVKDISGGLDGLAVVDAEGKVFILGAAANNGAALGPLDIGK